MQHESVVRLLAADIADPLAVLEGLAALRDEVDETRRHFDAARQVIDDFPGRAPYLRANLRYAERLLALQLEWLDEAESVLREPR